MSENYLVIGGTGVMGQFVTRQLVAQRNRPVVLCASGQAGLIADVRDHVELVRADLRDADAIERVVRENHITCIAHLGAIIGAQAEDNPRLAVQVDVEGTVNVLEAARLNNVRRVVYTSTKAAYGAITGEFGHPTYKPLTEDYPPSPADVYGLTKLASEHLGQTYSKRHGLEFIALRFASTLGPGKTRRHGSHAVNASIIENALAGKPTRIATGGDVVQDTIYNADSARGIIAALTSPTPRHQVFNIGTGRGITLHDLANAVRHFFPDAQIDIGPGDSYMPAGSTPYYCILDISRARDELHYEPMFADPVEIVRDYIAVSRALGLVESANQDALT
jgi:UDP-glucose 4-epimerase